MREWGDKQELLRAVEKARHEARNNVFPVQAGNETIEASLFVASMYAFHNWLSEQRQEPEAEPEQVVEAAPAPAPAPPQLTVTETTPQLPEVNYGD